MKYTGFVLIMIYSLQVLVIQVFDCVL